MSCDTPEIVIALAEAGADVNQYRDYDGITLLHIYSDAGEVEVVSALLACNASLTAKNTQGWLPIDVAATDEIIQLINDEDDRRRNHGLKRTVIPPPPPAVDSDAAAAAAADVEPALQPEGGDVAVSAHATAAAAQKTKILRNRVTKKVDDGY